MYINKTGLNVEVEVGMQRGEEKSSKGSHPYSWGERASAVKEQHSLSWSPLYGGDVTAGMARSLEVVGAFPRRPVLRITFGVGDLPQSKRSLHCLYLRFVAEMSPPVGDAVFRL
jgi:hypothetical protein